MKKVKNLFLIGSLVAGMFAFNSCSDKCKDVVCENGGTCDEETGKCICAKGYEGDDCKTEMRTKFLGTYQIVDACYPKLPINATITPSSEVTNVVISDILAGDLVGSVKAEVDGTEISIPAQQVVDNEGDTWTVEGTSKGTLSNNKFSIKVKFTYQGESEECVLTFTKQ